jgi:hypothetical protein
MKTSLEKLHTTEPFKDDVLVGAHLKTWEALGEMMRVWHQLKAQKKSFARQVMNAKAFERK